MSNDAKGVAQVIFKVVFSCSFNLCNTKQALTPPKTKKKKGI